jgi:hypothetical protein
MVSASSSDATYGPSSSASRAAEPCLSGYPLRRGVLNSSHGAGDGRDGNVSSPAVPRRSKVRLVTGAAGQPAGRVCSQLVDLLGWVSGWWLREFGPPSALIATGESASRQQSPRRDGRVPLRVWSAVNSIRFPTSRQV